MSDAVLTSEVDDGVAWLTLNRPQVMNSLNFELIHALRDQVESLRFDPAVRVIVISGAGEKAFCAGADLKERATLSPVEVKTYIHTIRSTFSAIERLPKVVIAAVNGVALGGGTELALASDLRVAASTATMGLTETRLAIIPGAGGTQRLPRLVGKGKAKELIFTGARIGADEALKIGLVNRVCVSQELKTTCRELADQICETGPVAIEQAKYAIDYGYEADLDTGMAIESNAYWVCIPTEDRLEGLAAFREKRKPVYKGR
jgi:enoyl-CoA hydratase/carnithine racemase